MSCVVWNVWGLGNQRTFRELNRLIAEKKPCILFLSESRRRNIISTQWKSLLGFDGCFMVDCIGCSGGLCLLWKEPMIVSVTSFSQGHIDCTVKERDRSWRFSGFYGNPDKALKNQFWDLFRRLAGIQELKHLPWLVGEDFNEICFDSEKWGGNPRPDSQMQGFRYALSDCALQDLFCHGEFFTSANRRSGNQLILERLDRFVGTLEWRMLYPTNTVLTLGYFHLDHRPLHIQLSPLKAQDQHHYHNKIPRFESGWLREPECTMKVIEGWRPFDGSMGLKDRIKSCSETLHQWAKCKLSSLPKRIKAERSKLNELKRQSNWPHNMDRFKELEIQLEKLCLQEEQYRRQRSRVEWLNNLKFNLRSYACKRSNT